MKKTVLITGATSGIGLATARAFHDQGFRLIITGRRAEILDALTEEFTAEDCLAIQMDVRDPEQCRMLPYRLPQEWQDIDVLVNNAGLALGLEPVYEGDPSDWSTMVDTNIKGLLDVTRALVPGMIARGHGHIINIGSVAGDAAYAGGAVYCATKAAVKAITDGLRIDLVDTPLRVTLIKPGLVETPFSTVRFHGDSERAAKVYTGIEALQAEDIADTIVYAAMAPAHVQIAEMLILATRQANGSLIVRH
ncbi:MAG: SDR family NAD(P)-dependent oxidoreductase [Muribaculaceae bacterium]|nr:SDR family NAD(P)-dependent oxidoreductase [Muribaculaceae bacterium]